MPNTATAENYEFTAKISTPNATENSDTQSFGFAISNGVNVLKVVLTNWHIYVSVGKSGGGSDEIHVTTGYPFLNVNKDDGGRNCMLVRSDDALELWFGTIHLITITADGVTELCRTNAAIKAAMAVHAEDFHGKGILAGFFGEGVTHAVGLGSRSGSALEATYACKLVEGAVTVNGMKITGSGKLSYNESTQNYFVEGTNGVRRYYKTMVGENFVLNAHISMTEVGGNGGHLAAVALTDGNDVLVLKYNIEQWGNLIIATGNSATETSAEFAITGFDWSGRKHTLASDTAKGETEMAFKLVKCGSVLYLFNHDGQPRAYFNKEGIHLIDSRILWGENNLSAVNDDIKGLFSTGDELAAGVFTYPDTGLRAEFDFEFTDDLEAVHTAAIDYGAMTLNLPEGCTLAKAYPVREGYGKGEIIQIGVNVKNARRAKLRLLVNDGNGQRIIDGKYDWSNGCIVFTLEYYGGETQADVTIVENGEMSWSNDWGEFIPDRDNTLLDQGGGA